MKYITIDLENNQPSGKIIQIGAVLFDTDHKTEPVRDQFVTYVNPKEEVNWQETLRSGETLEELLGYEFKQKWQEQNIPTAEALTKFWDWIKVSNGGKKIIQWGRGDLSEIITESKENKVFYPSKIRELNLKIVYQFLYQPAYRLNKAPGGLKSACRAMGLEFKGRAHDALVDALNTGYLALTMYNIIRNYSDIKNIIEKV